MLVVLWGTLTLIVGGCKKQELARLTIAVEGKELSDAYVFVDEKQVGSLIQTVIRSDGKVYIHAVFSATFHHQNNGPEVDTYTGCSDPLDLVSGKHTIRLSKGDAQSLNIVVNVSPGHHLLSYAPQQGQVKWDHATIQIDPGKTVVITSEKMQ